MPKGQLWVIEGSDGSGKATQTKLLVDKLNDGFLDENEAHTWAFPKYKIRPFGPLVRDYLNGVFGDALDVDPYFASMLYALDRWQDSDRMQSILDNNDWIVCDRYTWSNMAFQGIKIKDQKKREVLVNWIAELEFRRFGLPKPDKTIFLSLPPELSFDRSQRRKDGVTGTNGRVAKTDVHEDNRWILQEAYKQYHHLAKKFDWTVIDCFEEGRELTREEISDKIWNLVTTKTD